MRDSDQNHIYLIDIFFHGHYTMKDMTFIRTKKRGDKTYYYLVENKRVGKKVKQKVLKYLGTTLEGKVESNGAKATSQRNS